MLLLNDVERAKSHVQDITRARRIKDFSIIKIVHTAITFLVLERTFTKIACSIINERGASV